MIRFLSMMVPIFLSLISCIRYPALLEGDLVHQVENCGDSYIVSLNGKQYADTVVLEEAFDVVEDFEIEARIGDKWQRIYRQDRIDRYRLCVTDGVETDTLKINILKKKGVVRLDKISVYDSRTLSKKPAFIVSEYLTTEKGKLEKNIENPDFTGYFGVVDDLILIGEIALDAQGQIRYGEGKEDFLKDLELIRRIKKDINIVVDINIQTYTGKDNSETKNLLNKKMKEIVTVISDFANETGINGIDFDWEYPKTVGEWDAYSKLITELSAELKKSGRFVTVALAPWGCGLSPEACRAVKYVNLMTYDLFDDRGEHASFYNTTEKSVKQFLRISDFTKDQILLGLSFYGRTVDRSGAAWPDFRYDYENGKKLGKWGNYLYDYAYVEEGIKKNSYGYINGYAMTRDKTAYALYAGLGGVMAFRMICDAPYGYEYSLHKAIEEIKK